MPLGLIIAGDRKLRKGSTSGWVCSTAEEAKAILEMIARNMEKRGFRVLDRAADDNEELWPTPAESRDLYENHQKYAEKFQKEHGLSDWQREPVLEAVQCELEKLPCEVTQETRKQMVYLAAACGGIYIAKGGHWEWNEEMETAVLVIFYQDLWSEHAVNSPLALIFQAVQIGHLENVRVTIERDLKYTGNI